MGNIIGWLTDEMSTGTSPTGGSAETFHFYIPWVAFLLLSLLAAGYYKYEARKRFFGGHTLNKALLDKFTTHLGIIAIVGMVLLLCRLAGIQVFGLRLWRYGWALWAVVFFGYWAFYLLARYRRHLAAHNHQRMLERYMPKPKRGRKAARA
jgi:hypothetical protein